MWLLLNDEYDGDDDDDGGGDDDGDDVGEGDDDDDDDDDDGPKPRCRLRASLFGRNACQNFTRATLIKPEIYRKNAVAQNHGADCVRACAVETHVKISQEPALYRNLQENPAAQNHGADVAACAVETHMSRFHKSHFIRKFTGKMPRPRVSTHT